MPRIIVKKNNVQVDQYLVESGIVRIGRTPDNNIVLNDPSVSRSHAEIKLETDSRRITITDLNSSNGTYVNGIKISRTQVSRATIGVGVFQLEVGQPEPAVAHAPAAPTGDVEATVMFTRDPLGGGGAPAGVGSNVTPPIPGDDHAPRKVGWLARLFGKR